MRITVKFTSLFKILAGVDHDCVDMDDNATISQLAGTLSKKYRGLPFENKQTYYMVNGTLSNRDQVLADGDQVRIFQMFGGG